MDCRGFLRNLAMTGAWQSRTGRAAVIASLDRGVAIQTGTGRSHCEPRQRRGNPDQERAAVIASLDRGVAIQTRNGPRSLRASTEAWQSRSGTGRGHCEPRQRRGNPLLSQRVGAGAPLRAETETLAL